jgi:DNA-binding transcriptional LysR family regulator
MELLQLRYFLTVAKTLNISHAAKHHLIPQPAMSKTISKLEKELGTPLFNRYKNRLTLTEAGKDFYRSVSLSLSEIDNTIRQLNCTDAPLSGEICLLVSQHRRTVVDCIAEFKRLHPQVSFRIFYENQDSRYGEPDLVVSCNQPDDGFSLCDCLITEKLKLVLSRNHPLAKKEKVHFRELKDEKFALIDRNSFLWQHSLLHCQQMGFEPQVSIICGDLSCLMKYIGTGLAITIGPEISWQGLEENSVLFLPTIPSLSRSTYLYQNKKVNESRQTALFRNFLIGYFQGLKKSGE